MSLPSKKKGRRLPNHYLFPLITAFSLFITVCLLLSIAQVQAATNYIWGSDASGNFYIKERPGAGTPTPASPVFQMTNTGTISNASIPASGVIAGSFATGNYYFPSGSVGIGTTSPGTIYDRSPVLHVSSSGDSSGGYWAGRIIASGPVNAVVIGERNGLAVIGGHPAALSAWSDLYINPGGGNVQLPGSGIWNSSGNVGIGTTTPANKQHIYVNTTATGANDGTGLIIEQAGTGDASINFLLSAQARWNMGVDNSDGNKFNISVPSGYEFSSTGITIDTTGNVGIGVTEPGFKLDILPSADAQLRIGSYGGLSGDSSGGFMAGENIYRDNAGAYRAFVTHGGLGGGGMIVASGGINFVNYTGASTQGSTVSPTSRMYIDTSGSVGIGTTVPATKLTVVGSIGAIDNGNNPGIGLGDAYTAGNYGYIAWNSASDWVTVGTEAGGATIYVRETGLVGIGTSGPVQKLTVLGTDTGYPVAIGGGAQTEGLARIGVSTHGLDIGWSGASPWGWWIQGQINSNTTATPLLLNPNGGNVGIGTTNPLTKLSVNGSVQFICTTSGAWYPAAANPSCSDIAEVYPTTQELEAGDVLVVDPDLKGNVKKSDQPYQNSLVGVYSISPGMLIGGNAFFGGKPVDLPNNLVPVALVGRVPIKIASDSTPITSGDFITTSDQPGKAMKARKAGVVIGKALESWTPNSGKDKILVFVNLTWYDPDIYLTSIGDLKIVGDNGDYRFVGKDNSSVTRIGAFAELVSAKIRAGIIETEKLIVDGVDILKKLNELADKVNSQQQQIDSQQKQIEELRKMVEEMKK